MSRKPFRFGDIVKQANKNAYARDRRVMFIGPCIDAKALDSFAGLVVESGRTHDPIGYICDAEHSGGWLWDAFELADEI